MPEICDIIEPLIAAIQEFKNQGGTLTNLELQKILERLLPDWKGTPEQKQELRNELQGRLGNVPRREQSVSVSQAIEAAQTLKQLLKLFSKKDLIDLIEVLKD